jgi:hypothetical protein
VNTFNCGLEHVLQRLSDEPLPNNLRKRIAKWQNESRCIVAFSDDVMLQDARIKCFRVMNYASNFGIPVIIQPL